MPHRCSCEVDFPFVFKWLLEESICDSSNSFVSFLIASNSSITDEWNVKTQNKPIKTILYVQINWLGRRITCQDFRVYCSCFSLRYEVQTYEIWSKQSASLQWAHIHTENYTIINTWMKIKTVSIIKRGKNTSHLLVESDFKIKDLSRMEKKNTLLILFHRHIKITRGCAVKIEKRAIQKPQWLPRRWAVQIKDISWAK